MAFAKHFRISSRQAFSLVFRAASIHDCQVDELFHSQGGVQMNNLETDHPAVRSPVSCEIPVAQQ